MRYNDEGKGKYWNDTVALVQWMKFGIFSLNRKKLIGNTLQTIQSQGLFKTENSVGDGIFSLERVIDY